MPVNEKILFRSFQYLFSLKTMIYAILSLAMLRENHAFLGGKIPYNIHIAGGFLCHRRTSDGVSHFRWWQHKGYLKRFYKGSLLSK